MNPRFEDKQETARIEEEKLRTAQGLGRVIDGIAVGKGAYQNFRCSKCHWWQPNEHPMGICSFRHDRMYAQALIDGLPYGDALWTRADFACAEFSLARSAVIE